MTVDFVTEATQEIERLEKERQRIESTVSALENAVKAYQGVPGLMSRTEPSEGRDGPQRRRRRRRTKAKAGDRQRSILKLLEESPENKIWAADIPKELGISAGAARAAVMTLIERGEVHRTGNTEKRRHAGLPTHELKLGPGPEGDGDRSTVVHAGVGVFEGRKAS